MTAPLGHHQPARGTGKLTPPAHHATAAHEPAHHASHHEADASKVKGGVSRLRQAAEEYDADLPWRNNQDMNQKLSREIMARIHKQHATKSASAINRIVHQVVAENRAKLSRWDYDFHIDGRGKVMLDLNFTGKMDAFDSSGKTLRQELDGFLMKGGDPKVAEQILSQIDDPNHRIKQFRDNTCVAADVQRAIAKMNPQKYFAFASELLTHGHATLPNGKKLVVSAENRKWIDHQKLSPNQHLNAYFQCGLMEYANGNARYDIALDKSTDAHNQPTVEGMNIEAAAGLAADAGGPHVIVPEAIRHELKKRHQPLNDTTFYHEVVKRLAKAKGNLLVPVKVKNAQGKPAFHAVSVSKIENGRVYLYNPDNHAEGGSMTIHEFKHIMATQLTSHDHIGAGWGMRTTSSGGLTWGTPTPTATSSTTTTSTSSST
jgi:hypothetical protein